MVIANLLKNVDNAKRLIRAFVKGVDSARTCGCGSSLQHALVTDKSKVPAELKKDLGIIIGKYIA
jgi:5'-methylthioadenosine phosphorylase